MNRPKLTAKHPRPAAPARPPVRPGTHAPRNSARPAAPAAAPASTAPIAAPAAAAPSVRTASPKPRAAKPARAGTDRTQPQSRSGSRTSDTAAQTRPPRSANGKSQDGARSPRPRTASGKTQGPPRERTTSGKTQGSPRERSPSLAQDQPPKRAPGRMPDRPGGLAAPRPRPAGNAVAHTADEAGSMRLSKRMSELGLCSRREADNWIEQGLVLVDGVIIDTLGSKVRVEQKIEILPAARAEQAKLATILIHKPVGYVSGQPEDDYLPAAALITAPNQWADDDSGRRFQPLILRALAPAGRLDIDSTGLLVMTQDGRIAKQLIGEHSEVDKEYLVRVRYQGRDTDCASHFPADKLALLCHGLMLDEVALRPAQVDWQNGEQLRFILREGRKRQIRRMCELVGLEVVGLKRVRIGKIMLGALPPGQWRFLQPGEEF